MRTDLELLRAWSQGDQAAGGELIERFMDPLAQFFRGKVDGAVDDFVQETLTRSLKRLTQLRPDSSIAAYLFAIARNLLYEHYRKSAGATPVDPECASLVDLAPSPSTLLREGSEQRLMLGALHRIPVDSQVTLELFYWQELSVTEVAEVLGIPSGTVKSRLHRARQQLRRELEIVGRNDPSLSRTRSRVDDWDKTAK